MSSAIPGVAATLAEQEPEPGQEAPRYQVLVSLSDTKKQGWLAGIVTRTYAFGGGGLVLADLQRPLTLVPTFELGDDGHATTLHDDADLIGPKIATDVVVTGSVRLDAATRRHEVGVAVGKSQRRLVLLGPRRATVSRRGEVAFEEPAPFETLTLGLQEAYGGYDEHAYLGLAPPVPGMPHLPGAFAYPRNPMGKGWIIDLDRRRADGLELPRLEDPEQPLEAKRLFIADERRWIDAPAPGHLGWVPHHCYPRVERLVGPLAGHLPPVRPIFESTRPDGDDLPAARITPRGLQGAAPGLAVERLRGDELVVMRGMFPDAAEVSFSLPSERPEVAITMPAVGTRKPRPILQTVRVDLDSRTVSLTWFSGIRNAVAIPEDQIRRCSLEVGYTRI